MGTTLAGLPYPEPTDPIAAGAGAIRSLAESLQARTELVSWTNVSSVTKAVTFPKPFVVAPVVVVNDAGNTSETPRWSARGFNVTPTGFTIYLAAPVSTAPSTATNHLVQWFALGELA